MRRLDVKLLSYWIETRSHQLANRSTKSGSKWGMANGIGHKTKVAEVPNRRMVERIDGLSSGPKSLVSNSAARTSTFESYRSRAVCFCY